jgi:hypothetical protein
MKDEWITEVLRQSRREADFYSGCRKIIRNRSITFRNLWDQSDPLTLEDCGYTKSKMSHLTRGYLHQESVDAAIMLWNLRRQKTSYGSVGFTTYNHFLKNDPNNKSKRASVMGPCIQSITITQVSKNQYALDAFYRTTELLKKFPADLVFIRDVLLKGFNFEGMECLGLTCHFANVTIHPMYFVTIIPHLNDPLEELENIKKRDKYFYDWIIKWTARYICDEYHRGIAKFAQALRVKMDADKRITGKRRRKLTKYLLDNHPGHRNEYQEPEDEE